MYNILIVNSIYLFIIICLVFFCDLCKELLFMFETNGQIKNEY